MIIRISQLIGQFWWQFCDQVVMIVECVKTATGSNLGRWTLISDIKIRYSVWYWWEEQTSKHVCQWIYPLIVRTTFIDWPESSQYDCSVFYCYYYYMCINLSVTRMICVSFYSYRILTKIKIMTICIISYTEL